MEFKEIFKRIFLENNEEKKALPKITMAKHCLASHPDTKPWCLKKLAKHKHETIVVRVAEHQNSNHDILSELATHESPSVRSAVSENKNAPVHLLMALASDDSVDVRYCLAENHNLPLAVLNLLADDENPYVAARAAQTLNRLSQTKYNAYAWMPYFRHKRHKQDIG